MKSKKFLAILCCAMLLVSLTGCFPFNLIQDILQNNQSGGSDGPTSVIVTEVPSEEPSEEDSEEYDFADDFAGFDDLKDDDYETNVDDNDLGIGFEDTTAWYNADDEDAMWIFYENYAVLYEDELKYMFATFESYYDEDAVQYISNELAEYGLTEEEQRDALEDLPDTDRYFCIVFSDIEVYEDDIYVGGYEDDIIPYVGYEYTDDDIIYYDLINMADKEIVSYYTYTDFASTNTESEDTQRIGDEIFGYVDVPSNFKPFTNDVEIEVPNLQYSDITGNNIVTLQYYDGSMADAKTFAQTLSSIILNDPEVDEESVTGATVTLDGITAYQLYCYYPSYDRYLVTWCFDDTDDGYLHYVSVEFTPENYYLFEMVEDTYHLTY